VVQWRCDDCAAHKCLCSVCCRDNHTALPFHRVRHWNGRFYQRSSLWRVGVKIHLGHQGVPCPFYVGGDPDNICDPASDVPTTQLDSSEQDGQSLYEGQDPYEEDMEEYDEEDMEEECSFRRGPSRDEQGNQFITVVDVSGIHRLPVVRCNCRDTADDILFMEQELFPSTFSAIQTVFTFAVLKDYRVSNLECKVTAYHYYQKIRRTTSPTFPKSVPDRYHEFRRVSRQWRNLKLRQRSGAGHESLDKWPGIMALFCSACPQPGINVEPNWETDVNQ